MTENERVKQLRKAKGLTQESFGECIGLKKNSVSQIENGVNALSDQTRRSICREFGVREEWLRDGIGEMEDSTDTFDLDELADRFHATDLERELIKAYFEMDEVTRKRVMDTLERTILHTASAEPEAQKIAARSGQGGEYVPNPDSSLPDEEDEAP